MPAARRSSRSPVMTWAVKATIGMREEAQALLPSANFGGSLESVHSGIWTSIKPRRNLCGQHVERILPFFTETVWPIFCEQGYRER